MKLILTGEQVCDISQTKALLANVTAEAAIGAKGFDADALVNHLETRQTAAVSPPGANRTKPRTCDWYLYQERHLMKCFFRKITDYRRVCSRFEKTARNFLGFLQFVAALIWPR